MHRSRRRARLGKLHAQKIQGDLMKLVCLEGLPCQEPHDHMDQKRRKSSMLSRRIWREKNEQACN